MLNLLIVKLLSIGTVCGQCKMVGQQLKDGHTPDEGGCCAIYAGRAYLSNYLLPETMLNTIDQSVNPAASSLDFFGTNILAVSNKKQLLQFMRIAMKQRLHYADFVLFELKELADQYELFLTGNSAGEYEADLAHISIPSKDDLFRYLSKIHSPTRFEIEQMLESENVSFFIRELARMGFSSFKALPVPCEGRSTFLLLLLSRTENGQTDKNEVLDILALQLSGCLHHLRTAENVRQLAFEKEVLLSIIDDSTAVTAGGSFLAKIRERLKILVHFDDILVTGVETDKRGHFLLMSSLEVHRKTANNGSLHVCFDANDAILTEIIQSEDPVVFEAETLQDTSYGKSFYDLFGGAPIRQIIGIVLKSAGKENGILYLTNASSASYNPNDFRMIKGIAGHINLAVANLLSNALIHERDAEKAVLLALSSDIAIIKDQKQLLQVLQSKIKQLLPFNDICITLYNYDSNTHFAFLYSSEEKRRSHPDFVDTSEIHSPIADGVVNETIQSDHPVIFKIDELLKNEFVPEYVKFYKKTGIEEFVGVSMRNKDGIFGGLYVFSEIKNNYHPRQFGLIKGIANQLASTVSNLLAYEEIARKEKEKSVLLAISNDMATIKNKGDLLKVLHRRLTTMFYFDHGLIALTDNSRQLYSGNIFDPSAKCIEHPDYRRLAKLEYPLNDSLMKQVIAAESPVVFEIEMLIQSNDCPGYVLMNYDCGMREIVYTKLQSGNELIGFLILFSDIRNSFPAPKLELIKGLSYQLSNAVANIIASEEILNRERDKSVLLSISNDLAAVRNNADLYQVLDERLRNIFPYDHLLVGRISDDGNWFSASLLDPKSKAKDHPDYHEITAGKVNVNDEMIDVAFSSGRPMIFNLEDQLKKGALPLYLKINYSSGIREVVLIGLSNGQRKIGLLAIFSSQVNQVTFSHLNLIHGMSSQLATAIANILANDRIEQQVNEISEFKKQLEEENLYLQEEMQINNNYSEIIGETPVLQQVFQLVSSVASTTSSVLILGETGTGKELIARAIHNSSPRKDKLMVKVNCATLPANLIESELFGHEKGSFTGATDKRIGKFELANNSTLFLDEIGEMPLDLQVKLLRALQEKEIERVGGRVVIKTDVRIIAATNRDLQKEVLAGNFRSDLYFRLNVFPIHIPPLRERKDDIPLLANHFLLKHAKKAGKKIVGFSSRVMKELNAYNWPGNVRELEHLIERSILLTTQQVINQLHLPAAEKEEMGLHLSLNNIRTIDDVEREHIMGVLKLCKGKVAGTGGAAQALKIPSTTLNSKIKRLGIKKEYMTE